MNTEQERAEFEAWVRRDMPRLSLRLVDSFMGYTEKETQTAFLAYQAGRAALQSQSAHGWKEAFKAWNVCASIHREWAKGKDAVFTTRQADFVRHAEDAFKKSMGEDGLQSQDREDAERYRWLRENWFTMGSTYKDDQIQFYINGPRYSNATEAELDAAIDLWLSVTWKKT